MIISADIGGTKTNIGLSELSDPVVYTKQATFKNENFASFSDIVDQFTDPESIDIMVLGIAGPIKSRKVDLTNLSWSIDADLLEQMFSCKVFLLNDLQAAAYTIPYLEPEDIVQVYDPDGTSSDIEVIAAAGTGLGVAKIYHGSDKIVFSSEGGHIGLSPQSDFQHRFFEFIQGIHHHVSYEMSASSIGYGHLKDFLLNTNFFDLPQEFLDEVASESNLSVLISSRSGGTDKVSNTCQLILEEFSLMLGAFLGDLALIHLPRTVYLTGGIGRNISIPSKIREGFLDKANMSHVVEGISVKIITDPDCGLHGCSWFAKEQLESDL